ncbi:cytochrome c biogenesis CcdA family protein [Paracoccaceae bacterium GXU_MW_L88]
MIGFDIVDAGLLPAMIVALAAGALSFLSPCVLPIVPPYLAYMTGDAASGSQKRPVLSALFFVAGLSTVFLILGFGALLFGAVLMENQALVAKLSGAVVILFGLHFLGVIRIPLLYREARFDGGKGGSPLGAYVLGLAFAFGWTPCIGPMLGTILILVSQEHDAARGLVLMGMYAAGLGIPFLLAAAFLPRFTEHSARFRKHLPLIEKLMGGLLLIVGFLLITGNFAAISFWLLEQFPGLAKIG